MLKKQKILLVSYENDGYVIVEMAYYLKQRGFDVFVLIGDQHSLIRVRGWEDRCIKYGIDYSTIASAYKSASLDKSKPDWKWIKNFESTELYNKTFNELILTDQSLTYSHHNRSPYYKKLTKDKIYIFSESLSKQVHSLFEKIRPDFVVTIERNYFVKNVAAQISLKRKIPVLSYVSSRVGNYGVWLNEFGLSPSHDDVYIQNNALKPVESQLQNEFMQVVDNFVNGVHQGLYSARSHAVRKYKANILRLLTNYLKTEFDAWKKLSLHTYAFVRGDLKCWSTPLSGKFIRIRFFHLIGLFRSLFAYSGKDYEDIPEERKYILAPLHVLPESSTLTLGPEYYELDIIRRVSHALPADMVILVKENPSMTALRTRAEINALKKLPNVYYISPFIDTKTLIKNAAGIIGISGTGLLEAALQGLPALAYGHPEFSRAISHHGAHELTDFIKACSDDNDNEERKLKAYQYMVKMSEKVIPVSPLDLRKEAKMSHKIADKEDSLLSKVTESLIQNIRQRV